MKTDLIYKDESYKIIGACFEVYKDKGCGFLEAVFQECLEIEFTHCGIPNIPHPHLGLSYRGTQLKQKYQPDFLIYGKIILEIKATSTLIDEHRAQVLNYLHSGGWELGLLVNFGSYPKIQYERIALTQRKKISEKISF